MPHRQTIRQPTTHFDQIESVEKLAASEDLDGITPGCVDGYGFAAQVGV